MRAGFKLRQITELLLGDACSSANGRMDVDSKWTAHHYGHLDLRHLFQHKRHCSSRSGVDIHPAGQFKQLGIVGAKPDPKMNPATSPLHKPIDDAGAETRFFVRNADCSIPRTPSEQATVEFVQALLSQGAARRSMDVCASSFVSAQQGQNVTRPVASYRSGPSIRVPSLNVMLTHPGVPKSRTCDVS